MNRIRCLVECLASYLLLPFVTGVHAYAEEVACPVIEPSSGIFSGGKVYENSIVAIEKNVKNDQIDLSLYRPKGGVCEKTIFAKYSKEGGIPNLDSLFFLNLNENVNVFTIVHWEINSRGIGTFGKYYQVYAYSADSRGGLEENKFVINKDEMGGMDGYQEGRPVSFPYQNAASVRNFFKCRNAACK